MSAASLPKHAIPFAWHRGRKRMVTPQEVSKGLACDCICSACEGELVAKKGDERVWHFAHRVKSDCPSGIEAAVHRMAKQLIADRGEIFVPARCLTRTIHGPGRVWTETLAVEIQVRGPLNIPDCAIEQQIGDRRDANGYRIPDVSASFDGALLAIEIKNTHAVDPDKETWLTERGVSTLEIDVSDLVGDSADDIIRALQQRLFEADSHTAWLTHRGDAEGQRRLTEEERRVRAEKVPEEAALLAEHERAERRRSEREAFRAKTRHIERRNIHFGPGSTLVIARSELRVEAKVFGHAPDTTFERLCKLCRNLGGRFNSQFERWEFVAKGATQPAFSRLCSLAEADVGQALGGSPGSLGHGNLSCRYVLGDPADQEAFEERAAILQFDAGLSCTDAEKAAWSEMLQQGAVPTDGLNGR